MINDSQLQKQWDKAKENLKKQEECFRNVLNDRKNMDDETFDSYCEEMQYALDEEERLWKKAENRLY